jgi:hypothetical protein
MNGKGDKRRPININDKQMEKNWMKTFSKRGVSTIKTKGNSNGS